jgi:hypothetical protein
MRQPYWASSVIEVLVVANTSWKIGLTRLEHVGASSRGAECFAGDLMLRPPSGFRG